jgi:hypothetical protein
MLRLPQLRLPVPFAPVAMADIGIGEETGAAARDAHFRDTAHEA